MHFNSLLPLALIISLTSHASAHVAPIEAAFLTIADILDDFGSAFSIGASASKILDTGDELLISIDDATPVIQNTPSLNIFQAINLANSLASVGDSAKFAFDTIAAGRPAADALAITANVRELIFEIRPSIAILGAALGPKVPSLFRGQVRDAVAAVDARLASAITVYT